MTAQAKNLSGGQKRKLSVGIAILGDPKVPESAFSFNYSLFFFLCVYPHLKLQCLLKMPLTISKPMFAGDRSCSWTSPQQAWTPAPDTRSGRCWRAAELAESLSSALTTWMRLTFSLVQHNTHKATGNKPPGKMSSQFVTWKHKISNNYSITIKRNNKVLNKPL